VKLPRTARTPRPDVSKVGELRPSPPLATGHGIAFVKLGGAATRIICTCGTEIVHPGRDRLRVMEHRQHLFLAEAMPKVAARARLRQVLDNLNINEEAK
jgi:hypothetical protein